MKEIEVTWKATPTSGISWITLKDLGCKTKKEWKGLDKEEQEKRLKDALLEYDLSTVVFTPTDWEG